MLHVLKRHPIPISAFFRHSLVLTYAFPPETLQPLLPQGLVLDTFRGFAFLAVALVQTEDLRPSFLPAAIGRDFFLSGYRIFTRLAGGTQSKRGLRILRSDTDHPWMVCAGNLLTHYNYHLCQVAFEEHSRRNPLDNSDPAVRSRSRGVRTTIGESTDVYPADLRSALWPRRGDLRVLCPIPSTMRRKPGRSSVSAR